MTYLARLKDEGRGQLSEAEVKSLLAKLGIMTTRFVVPERHELRRMPFPFPMAVKVSSAEVLHKTEVGGVFLNIHNIQELEEKYDLIASRFPGTQVLVEAMEPPGPEVIIGLAEDAAFGMCIMFGVGGVQAELYKDVSFRTIPIERYDAEEMISETRAITFFEGFRGIKGDKEAVIELLCQISMLAMEHGEIVQMDLNPVILREHGYIVVDAKLKLRTAISKMVAMQGIMGDASSK